MSLAFADPEGLEARQELLLKLMIFWSRHDAFDFCHCDDRQVPAEQCEQRKEQSKASDKHQYVYPGRMEISPTRGNEVPAKGRDGNYESLKPHSNVHKDANDDHKPRCCSAPLYPERLWN